jgi:hypothetical protein
MSSSLNTLFKITNKVKIETVSHKNKKPAKAPTFNLNRKKVTIIMNNKALKKKFTLFLHMKTNVKQCNTANKKRKL